MTAEKTTQEKQAIEAPKSISAFQVVHECGCGNVYKEKPIAPDAKVFEIRDVVCAVCPNARRQLFPMMRRVDVISIPVDPKKTK